MRSRAPGGTMWRLPKNVREGRLEAGGVNFRYLESGPQSSAARSILLLHGFGARSEIWLRLLKDLPPDWQVVAPDFPGHGNSSPLPGKSRTLPEYHRALAAFLEDKFPGKVTIVGSSMGGALATLLSLSHPNKVDRLVLAGASGLTPKLPGKTVRLYFPYILGTYFGAPGEGRFRSFLTKGVFFDPKFIEDRWLKVLVEEWKPRPRRMAYVATANALRRPDASVASSLGKVRVPTLLLWGKNDAHFDCAENEAAARAIPGSRFVRFENCGHLPMVEKYSESLAELKGFLG